MIEAKNIYKNYGSVEVLKGIDLHIAEGEIVSIIGKSGAGKTTLLQILGLLDAPTNAKQNGSFLGINGEQNVFDISEEAKAKVRNYNIGFIFQQHQLIPEFTALENILIPVYIAKQDIKEYQKTAIEIATKLNINHRLEHKPNQLSGGEKQRIAVIRSLIMNPKIILADEPTGSLDSKNKIELQNILWNIRDEYKKTIVIVTHDKELAQKSDRIIEIQDGKIYEK